MNNVVVLQPQFFPWVGVFEQIRLADVYVHFDDVQFPQGRSFASRVQIKSPQGPCWMTAPVTRRRQQRFDEVEFDDLQPWREAHLRMLAAKYSRAPHAQEMLDLVADVYHRSINRLADLNIAALERIADYFGLRPRFVRSSSRPSSNKSTARLVEIVRSYHGDTYITGHGAKNYLEHELFEEHGIQVEYMDYRKVPYPQLHGPFDPHVSILDLIANMGLGGLQVICSTTRPWREFPQQAA